MGCTEAFLRNGFVLVVFAFIHSSRGKNSTREF